MCPAGPERLLLLVERDGGHAADDAVIVLGLLDLVVTGAWSMRRHGLRRRWRLERIGEPPAGQRALVTLDQGLASAPREDGTVPVQALGWWMRHYAIGATRVRQAAGEDVQARGGSPAAELPPRPARGAPDLEVALGGFAVTAAERDFARRLLRARDRPTGLVGEPHNGDNVTAAARYGAGAAF